MFKLHSESEVRSTQHITLRIFYMILHIFTARRDARTMAMYLSIRLPVCVRHK